MAAIVEFTNFDNAVDAPYDVTRLFNMADRPGTIFISIPGENPGYAVGDEITYVNGRKSFTGNVWYIWKGPSGFNLYVKHPDWEKFNGLTGGTVYPGGKGAYVPRTLLSRKTVMIIAGVGAAVLLLRYVLKSKGK